MHSITRHVVLGIVCPVLWSCSDSGVEPVSQEEEPVAPAVSRWSDPATWPNRIVPMAGAAVVIPKEKTVLLDVSPPALRSLRIDGQLVFGEQDLNLSADWIMVHGTLRVGTEAEPFRHRAVITLTGANEAEDFTGMGTRVLGVMDGTLEMHGMPRLNWARLAATAAKGASQLVLERSPDWQPGDRIVVASTDYDALQAEEAIVKAVTGSTVVLEQPLRYAHWGTVQTIAGRPVDERAEVGLLTRNVVVRGDTTATGFGGHIMVMGTSKLHLEGAELYRMGQRSKTARYPIHWHLMGAADGQYARNNSIWRSFNRCLTIHGTDGLLVEGNVCHDHVGHGFFLEDGAETRNTLVGNLGVLTRAPAAGTALLASDANPATFWITNPDNTIRNNVAAGSQGFGFWIALPEHPTGFSSNPAIWPRRTPLREFSGNVAHSNRRVGLNVDDGPLPDGTTETTSYRPRQNPGVDSPPVIAEFRNFTAFKHTGRAVWLRGNSMRLVGGVLADNAIGATFAASETFLQDALVVGESENRGTPLTNGFPIRGYEFYDGRVAAQRVTFANFQPNAQRQASALGFNRSNGFTVTISNFAEGVQLVNANGVYLDTPRPDKDGDKNAVIFDRDGTISGTAGAYVVANNPLLVTPGCTFRSEWNSHVCRDRYVDLRLQNSAEEAVAPLDLRRDDGATGALVGVPNNPRSAAASAIAGRAYTIAYRGGVPSKPRLSVSGLGAADWIKVALPYPVSSFLVYRDGDASRPLGAAANLAEMDAGAGSKYWFDPATGTLHLKAVAKPGTDRTTIYVDPR